MKLTGADRGKTAGEIVRLGNKLSKAGPAGLGGNVAEADVGRLLHITSRCITTRETV
ncbi:MAG: hypothetical protein AB7F32_04075 [Victivallaceae bacterium]